MRWLHWEWAKPHMVISFSSPRSVYTCVYRFPNRLLFLPSQPCTHQSGDKINARSQQQCLSCCVCSTGRQKILRIQHRIVRATCVSCCRIITPCLRRCLHVGFGKKPNLCGSSEWACIPLNQQLFMPLRN